MIVIARRKIKSPLLIQPYSKVFTINILLLLFLIVSVAYSAFIVPIKALRQVALAKVDADINSIIYDERETKNNIVLPEYLDDISKKQIQDKYDDKTISIQSYFYKFPDKHYIQVSIEYYDLHRVLVESKQKYFDALGKVIPDKQLTQKKENEQINYWVRKQLRKSSKSNYSALVEITIPYQILLPSLDADFDYSRIEIEGLDSLHDRYKCNLSTKKGKGIYDFYKYTKSTI